MEDKHKGEIRYKNGNPGMGTIGSTASLHPHLVAALWFHLEPVEKDLFRGIVLNKTCAVQNNRKGTFLTRLSVPR